MINKHILVLANSIKHNPGRCIAGLEILDMHTGGMDFGQWIRPISRIGEGELYRHHYMLDNNNEPTPFDIIEIDLEEKDTEATQPENWFVPAQCNWKYVPFFSYEYFIHGVVEHPKNLWLQPNIKTDRVTTEFMQRNPPKQSLYLIELLNVTLIIVDGKVRLLFYYNGAHYNLSVTDPLTQNILSGSNQKKINRGYACISLAPAFYNKYDGKMYHYKLAAMVLPHE